MQEVVRRPLEDERLVVPTIPASDPQGTRASGRARSGRGSRIQQNMVWLMLGFLLVCALCSWARPDGALARSAARAFNNSVWLFSQGVEDEEVDEDDDLPRPPPRQRTPSPGAEHGVAPTATRRRRCSPFQAKRIVAAQGWLCACGCVDLSDPLRRGLLLDEFFEIDHIRPLAAGGSNAESNLRALLRTHHQAISSAFARGRPS